MGPFIRTSKCGRSRIRCSPPTRRCLLANRLAEDPRTGPPDLCAAMRIKSSADSAAGRHSPGSSPTRRVLHMQKSPRCLLLHLEGGVLDAELLTQGQLQTAADQVSVYSLGDNHVGGDRAEAGG